MRSGKQTLHDAIRTILEEFGQPMKADEIAKQNELHYHWTHRSGKYPNAAEIMARVTNPRYKDIFRVDDDGLITPA